MAGIDYGRGQTNIDHDTGIRYGCISQNSILQAWAESSEGNYGDATCPKCGGDVVAAHEVNNDGKRWPRLYSHSVEDYACESCEHYLDSGDVFSDEAHSYFVNDDVPDVEGETFYKAETCLDNDVMVMASWCYTFAPFCSPCVPGAGNLDSSKDRDADSGVATYCFGHEWFYDTELGRAPYPVFGRISNRPCFPDEWYGR